MRRLVSFFLTIPLLGALGAPATAQSPTTTEELLAGMVTDEIAPGVYRVVNDGVRDLSHPDEAYWGDDAVLVGGVGDVWRITPPRRLFRLGREAEWSYDRDLVVIGQANTETTRDGRLWTVAAPDGFRVFDGGSWSSDFGFEDRFDALATQSDGTVWFLDDDGLIRMPPNTEDLDFSPIWEGVSDDEWVPPRLAVTDAGEAWLINLDDQRGIEAFLRFDGDVWQAVPAPDGVEPASPADQSWDVGLDGTLWTLGDSLQVHKSLARLDEEGWTVFTEADGVEPWGGQPTGWFPTDQVAAAPDGSVWVNATDETTQSCAGLARFDGETWTPYLAGQCISDLDFAPDGSVWVVAREPDFTSEVDTYVITPEAVGAAE